MSKHENFHPKVIIANHFDDLRYQIDIKTETLFQNSNLTEKERDSLNELREKQIEKINEIEKINLNTVKFDEEKFKTKWSYLLNNSFLDHEYKLQKIKEETISNDCLIFEDPASKSEISIWITSGYYTKQNVEFLR